MILGINVGKTHDGIELADGGACLMSNDGDIICAVAEERVSGKKHAGGYANAAITSLTKGGGTEKDVTQVVISNCCEKKAFCNLQQKQFPNAKITPVGHHLSHAASAFFCSSFEKALVIVCDNEGNVLKNTDSEKGHRPYWENKLERTSYFLGVGNKLSLICREFDAFNTPGIGEWYHRMTHFIGFGHHDAGKTMGLAPYGNPESYSNLKLFDRHSSELAICNFKGGFTPEEQYGLPILFHKYNIPLKSMRSEFSFEDIEARDLAAFIQRECSNSIIKSAEILSKRYEIKHICVAGGFGLNCVTNRLLTDLPNIERVFVQPAAGDSGQCLGNAILGYLTTNNKPSPKRWQNYVYTGPTYLEREYELALTQHKTHLALYCLSEKLLSEIVAKALHAGAIVGICRGRSELGPRALGHRSILADPRTTKISQKLNKIKGRELWRPLAPVTTWEDGTKLFDLPQPCPHMTMTVRVYPFAQRQIPGATHVDGSARVQTVSPDEEIFIYHVLKNFYRHAGVACLLNTSFNAAGDPIVETPVDAVKSFLKMNIDLLVLENRLVANKDKTWNNWLHRQIYTNKIK